MRHHRSLILLLVLAFMLPGCTTLSVKDAQTGTWLPVQAAIVEVHRDIPIRGGRTRAFFQNGRQVWHPGDFEPFCQLEVSTLTEETRTVHPDTFMVTRVSRRMDEVVEARPVMLASLAGVRLADDGGQAEAPSPVTLTIRFRLHSDRQPDVRTLACGGAFDFPGLAEAPTLQEIADALGEHASLILNAPGVVPAP